MIVALHDLGSESPLQNLKPPAYVLQADPSMIGKCAVTACASVPLTTHAPYSLSWEIKPKPEQELRKLCVKSTSTSHLFLKVYRSAGRQLEFPAQNSSFFSGRKDCTAGGGPNYLHVALYIYYCPRGCSISTQPPCPRLLVFVTDL
jgi:hypothetical protein